MGENHPTGTYSAGQNHQKQLDQMGSFTTESKLLSCLPTLRGNYGPLPAERRLDVYASE